MHGRRIKLEQMIWTEYLQRESVRQQYKYCGDGKSVYASTHHKTRLIFCFLQAIISPQGRRDKKKSTRL